MLPAREQSFRHKGTCALNHWVPVALSQIFKHAMCDQLVSPTRRNNYLIAKRITGVRQLYRRSRQCCEQRVIADYGDGKRK